MNGLQELDRRGRELLTELAVDPDSESGKLFDALFYPPVSRYLRANHAALAPRVARYLSVDGVAPDIQRDEIAEVAHEATLIALRRVRQNAATFDPDAAPP